MKTKFLTLVIVIATASAIYAQEPAAPLRLTPKRLTNINDSYPMLSPDGTRILFKSDRTGNSEIYIIGVDGKGLRQLTNNNAPDNTPIWSPDGGKIVFASERDNDSEIYIMNADGSDQRRLTNQPGDDSHPHWSPDGTRIVFNSARTTPDLKADWGKQIHEVFGMKADGSDVKQISRLKSLSTYPSYSPDGKQICFRSVTDEPAFRWDLTNASRNSEVFVMNADGSNPVNLTKNAAYDGWPTWSPDGRKILFSSNRAGPANIGQFYVINPDGTGLQKITDGPGSFVQGSWSRDGKKIFAQQHWETEEFGNLVEFEVPAP
jgi:Tol biopolymer transport system component